MIKIDHKPLKYLLESHMQNKEIQLWVLSMTVYNCSIEYISHRHQDNANRNSLMQIDSQVHVDVEENRDSKMSMTICMRLKPLIRMSLIQTHFTRCYFQNDKYF